MLIRNCRVLQGLTFDSAPKLYVRVAVRAFHLRRKAWIPYIILSALVI